MEKKEKKNRLSRIEIIIITLFALFFLTIPFFVYLDFIDLKYLELPTNVGNSFAGLLIPFLTFIGSILVYVAFKAQIQANREIQEQFKKQNNDEHFFRLVDTLDKRITQYSFSSEGTTYSSYDILTYFSRKIRSKLFTELPNLGEEMFIRSPSNLPHGCFIKLYSHISQEKFSDIDSFKNALLESERENRKDLIKKSRTNFDIDFPEQNYEPTLRKVALSIFYKADIDCFQQYYFNTIVDLINTHSSFFDGYFKNLNMILRHVEKSENNEFYIDYLNESLTTIEKIIIFIYIGTFKGKEDTRRLLLKYKLLDSLAIVKGVKVGDPSPEQYLKHINDYISRLS